MLLMDLNDAAIMPGIAAPKAGASWEDMQAVVGLCFLFRGLSARLIAAPVLANICDREARRPHELYAKSQLGHRIRAAGFDTNYHDQTNGHPVVMIHGSAGV